MQTFTVRLNDIDLVKSFTDFINKQELQADLQCESYTVDARSILGILTMNLTKDLTLCIRSEVAEENKHIIEEGLQPYLVKH